MPAGIGSRPWYPSLPETRSLILGHLRAVICQLETKRGGRFTPAPFGMLIVRGLLLRRGLRQHDHLAGKKLVLIRRCCVVAPLRLGLGAIAEEHHFDLHPCLQVRGLAVEETVLAL